MRSQPLFRRAVPFVAVLTVALSLSLAEPTVAAPATPEPSPTATPTPEPAPDAQAPSIAEERPSPSPEAPQGQALQAPAATAVDDPAISAQVSLERTQIPEPAAQAMSADDESVVEQTDLDPFHMAAVSWEPGPSPESIEVDVRVRIGGAWGEWQRLSVAEREDGQDVSATDPLWTNEAADAIAVRAASDSGPLKGVAVTTVDPGAETVPEPAPESAPSLDKDAVAAGKTDASSAPATAAVSRPPIITRAGWGAGRGKACDATRGKMRGIVIHHTAGANSYTKGQSAGIVRSYQAMHINVNGWCDIGYNFLVDKYGQIFEGRASSITKHVRGAHAGVGAVNDNTTGIAMMGNFESADIRGGSWATLRSTVTKLVAWRLSMYGLKPLTRVTIAGRTNFTVNGHRDWMATACPGRYGLAWLNAGSGLRADVDRMLLKGNGSSSALPAPKSLRASAASPSSISVAWNSVSGASKYRIRYRQGTTGTPKQWSTQPKGTSAKITGLKANSTYSVAVAAARSNGKVGAYTAYKPLKTAPTTPSGLKATQEGRALKVSWKASAGAKKYRIWYREGTKGAVKKLSAEPTGTSATITGLKNSATYQVSVAALGVNSGESPRSAYASFKTGPAAPKGLKATTTSSTLKLSWQAVSGATKYRILYREGTKGSGKLWTVQPTGTSVNITGLKPNTTYSVAVAAATKSGRGDYATYQAFKTKPQSTAGNSGSFANGSVTMKGHGYGHGIGMSQYGAQGGALKGKSHQQILAHYYPGTKLAKNNPHIRVKISGVPTSSLTVKHRSGLLVQTSGGPNQNLPGTVSGRKVSQWRLVFAADRHKTKLQYRSGSTWRDYKSAWKGSGQFGVPNSTVTAVFDGKERTFRGVIRWKSNGASRVTVNELFSLDEYVRGVVAKEMPASWHREALRSQAVAARTYGLSSVRKGGLYDVCDTTSCQVYGGVNAETSQTNAAVDGTRGTVLTYKGKAATAQYSSSSGGYTNWSDFPSAYPYLRPVRDDWDGIAANPNRNWQVKVSATAVSRAYPQIGTPKTIKVLKRNGYGDMGGRVDKVRITGSKGSVDISGNAARRAFGLKSSWFGF